MPFTPSHALVALPFIRTPLIPAAIAIGAMTPDLPLFLRGIGVNYSFTHTFGNVVWTTLIAFVLFLVWRVVLRPALPDLLPLWLSRRLPQDWSERGVVGAGRAVGVGQARAYPLLLGASLLLGVLSHIVWDLFTHAGRWGTQLLPVLNAMWGPLSGYKWLQHGSSVLGLLIIGAWALLWISRRNPRAEVSQRVPAAVRVVWWLSLPVILIAAWVLGLALYGASGEGLSVQQLAYRMLPPACAVWGVITLLLCVVLATRPAGGQDLPAPADPA
ncbi:MAG TPA: DUF4184 domain-containing protein [Microbacterium sp.]|nr:DUF4184 domain-containing protein [Microbacterium sp.]